MKRNLKFKAFIIVAVILFCLYGIIGLPKSKAELVDNWNHSIHLGLDLKGGTHLVMQVQLQDAFKAAADTAMVTRGRSSSHIRSSSSRSRWAPSLVMYLEPGVVGGRYLDTVH